MNSIALLEKYIPGSVLFEIILEHSMLVADKALKIAGNMGRADLDMKFIEEAAMLHDIGVCRTSFHGACGNGLEPYIRHGLIGRDILEKEGLPRHALVCERHIGVGLTVEDIRSQGLPLPERDMVPVSAEEKIISFADLFYTKKPGSQGYERKIDEIKTELKKYGDGKLSIFENWIGEFGG
jgi:uncharacterized protein